MNYLICDYSFDLRFNNVDVAFVLGSFCLGLGLGLVGWCLLVLVLVLRVDVLLTPKCDIKHCLPNSEPRNIGMLCRSKYAKMRFRPGPRLERARHSPRPPVGWEGTPLPICHPTWRLNSPLPLQFLETLPHNIFLRNRAWLPV